MAPNSLVHFETSLQLQEADISIARGNITGYKVSVHSQNFGFNFSADTNADARSYTVQFCADCEVTVSAHNSKGMSPPARIPNHHRNGNFPYWFASWCQSLPLFQREDSFFKRPDTLVTINPESGIHTRISSFSQTLEVSAQPCRQPQCHHLLEETWNCTATCSLCGGVVPTGPQDGGAPMGQTEQGWPPGCYHRWDKHMKYRWNNSPSSLLWFSLLPPSFFNAGIQPYECYEGAVSVVYHDNSVSRSPFTGVTILESGTIQRELNSADPVTQHYIKGPLCRI